VFGVVGGLVAASLLLMGVTMGERKAVTKHLALRYRSADRTVKSEFLTELVGLTGRHRDHAPAALRQHWSRRGRGRWIEEGSLCIRRPCNRPW
jgi:hypothetical protein